MTINSQQHNGLQMVGGGGLLNGTPSVHRKTLFNYEFVPAFAQMVGRRHTSCSPPPTHTHVTCLSGQHTLLYLCNIC